jgi:Protein of unknown function (DUF421)
MEGQYVESKLAMVGVCFGSNHRVRVFARNPTDYRSAKYGTAGAFWPCSVTCSEQCGPEFREWGDNTALGGLISATTLIVIHYAVAIMTFMSKKLEVWIEGAPRKLIHNGVLNGDVMRRELMTRRELAAALRAAGCTDIYHVRVETLENNGQITVSLQARAARKASHIYDEDRRVVSYNSAKAQAARSPKSRTVLRTFAPQS